MCIRDRIYTALEANFPMSDVSFNGNNKSEEELVMAIENNLGTIIVDNFFELHLLHDLLAERDRVQNILLRITPGVEAHTHDYISTGQTDSKFGFDVNSGQAQAALQEALADPHLSLIHISEPTRRTPISYAVFCLKKKKKHHTQTKIRSRNK